MAGAEITRPQYRRDGLRYASDTTDDEWTIIAPHLPPPAKSGRPRTNDLRDMVNAIFYIAQTGWQWRMPPKDLPPFTSVQRYSYGWCDDGRWQMINPALLMATREAEGREVPLRWLSIGSAEGTFARFAQPPALSTANRSRPPKPVVRAAMLPRRR